jgi:ABC-type uncharacterized transport system fused permease/ATPase subunit
VCPWEACLSAGEQQRLSFARLLLARPRIAFLDEATSALDTENETHMYTLLARTCPCFVSVGHRAELRVFHTHKLVQKKIRPDEAPEAAAEAAGGAAGGSGGAGGAGGRAGEEAAGEHVVWNLEQCQASG